MSNRPSTPPRPSHSGNLPANPPTPEQVRKTEEARLRAKALRTQHDAQLLNPSVKRSHAQMSSAPASVRNASSTSTQATALTTPAADAEILRPAKNLGKYIDYDFSTMVDTKGGFLSATDDPDNKALHAGSRVEDPAEGKPAGMTMEEWERHQLLQKLRATRSGPFEPGLSVLDEEGSRKTCRECGGLEVDWIWIDIFGCAVCKKCKEKFPEKYSLLTKTEAREDYLLTNPELQDPELLPHQKKRNPHKATWNDMQLYLRYQVEEYAFSEKKWGSAEALDEEFERRQTDKKSRKERKFKEKLLDLKKKTRTEAYRRNKAAGESEARFGMKIASDRHIHEWGRPVLDAETGVEVKRCIECGQECEELELG